MKVLVTGSSGFIGTNFVQRLLDDGVNVLGIDIVEPMNCEHNDIYRFCDIRNLNDLACVVESFNPNYLVHLAARTDLKGDTLSDYDSNIIGVENICKVVEKCKTIQKVIFASSMLVCEGGYTPSSVYDFKPSTPYGESKVKGEKIVRANKEKLPDFSIVRPTSIWGPWFRTPYRDFFDIVLAGRFIDFGKKLSTKTYGYVGNTVNQILSLMYSKESYSENIIYLGDNTPINIAHWARDIKTLSGNDNVNIRLPYISLILLAKFGDFVTKLGFKFPMTSFRLKNMTTNNVIDCNLIESINSYPRITYNDSLIQTLNWMNKNKVAE